MRGTIFQEGDIELLRELIREVLYNRNNVDALRVADFEDIRELIRRLEIIENKLDNITVKVENLEEVVDQKLDEARKEMEKILRR